MAKLNVVIPSVDIEVDGVKYRKVERKAVAGDIVKVLSVDYDLTLGAFYPVVDGTAVDEPSVIDNVNDEVHPFGMYPQDFEVYEKVTGTTTAPVKYREVKRKANVGERIKIINRWSSNDPYENGAEFTVVDVTDIVLVIVEVNGDCVRVNDKEYVVLEPIEVITELSAPTQPERLKVGEYAKVIDTRTITGENRVRISIGDIRKITVDDGTIVPFSAIKLDGSDYDWFREEALVRATDAEVAAAKQALERTKAIGEFAEGGYAIVVDATIGSTLGFERGDYVIVRIKPDYGPSALIIETKRGNVGYCNADALRKITKEEYEAATKPALIPVGQYGKITHAMFPENSAYIGTIVEIIGHDGPSIAPYSVRTIVGGVEKFALADGVVPVTSVEAEAVRKEAQEIAQWAKIGRKVGEYKAGDVVEVTKFTGYVPVGSIGVVYDALRGGSFRVNTPEHTSGNFHGTESVKLIAPVESLFNVTAAGGERK